MQLTFLILALCSLTKRSATDSPPGWRRSRYIIDNRRNALFLKKPSAALRPGWYESPNYRFGQETFRQKLYPVERYNKDLTAEASISEPTFYQKFGENSLPGKYKIGPAKEFGVFENRKNISEVLDRQNFIQNEDELTTTEKMLSWVLKKVASESSPAENLQKPDASSGGFDFANPLGLSKTKQGNRIDAGNEKHVYETRIETVSYHQEVIFNSPPQNKQKLYQKDAENYEESEKNYEESEKNYEESEKNYEESEKNYEEIEQNYELEEAMNVMSEGRIRPSESYDSQKKFGYVVEGTNYRKYRVEERTADGFIVGEYGVVSHDDGSLRGVRYTADGSTNPKLIYETLIKFLSL